MQQSDKDKATAVDISLVKREEEKWIEIRRENAKKLHDAAHKKKIIFKKDKKTKKILDTVGLALSGGGIRSATFNLGLLQALSRWKVFPFIDYLSTVSGGGYIGSCLTWFMSTLKEFPFGEKRKDHDGLAGRVLYWLRSHGKYLVPGEGITSWALAAAVIKGIFINLLIIVPAFLFLFKVMILKLPDHGTVFDWLVYIGGLSLLTLLAMNIIAAVTSRFNICRNYHFQLFTTRIMGGLLLLSVVSFIIGFIPVVYELTKTIIYRTVPAITFSGIITLAGAMKNLNKENETGRVRSLILSLGLILLVFGIFLFIYHVALHSSWYAVYLSLAVLAVMSVFTDVNHVSMHRYYRDRLMEAYMPAELLESEVMKRAENADKQGMQPVYRDPDSFLLREISNDAGNPYHLINTNLLTINSGDWKLHSRGGDNFILSPLYCGAESTGYRDTKEYVRGRMNLATAFAVSGAAVDPNTYVTRSRPVAFIMTLLNARLGYWIRNPKQPRQRALAGHQYLAYMLLEMLGVGLTEKKRSIHLADGGHYENLGLYELIRRRVKYIIVSDCGGDAGYRFEDLGKIIEMARVDFGASVDIKIDKIRPDEKTGLSELPFALGTITHTNPEETSHLLYLRPAMIKDLEADIDSYKKLNPSFPAQTTVDQFFGEDQFEAYRELGYRIGTLIFENRKNEKVDDEFTTIKEAFQKAEKNMKKKR